MRLFYFPNPVNRCGAQIDRDDFGKQVFNADYARAQAIDLDAVLDVFRREAFSHVNDAGFGYAVNGLRFRPDDVPADRADQNDFARPVLDHGAGGGLGTEKGALQVNVHEPIPFMRLNFLGRFNGQCHTGVIDANIEAAQCRHGFLNHAAGVVGLADIGVNGH